MAVQSPVGITEELLAAAGGPTCSVPPEEGMPFPLVALPPVLQGFVRDASHALGVAPECVATPAIAACATAIGNTYRIGSSTSAEPCVIWAVMLLESAWERQAYRDAVAPLVERQRRIDASFEELKAEYEWQKRSRARDRAKRKAYWGEEPVEMVEPAPPVDSVTAQHTLNALAAMLERSPRGLALTPDDLDSFFLRPKGSRRNGEAQFLTCYQAGALRLYRAGGRRVYVPNAALNIFGPCQPASFLKALGTDGHYRDVVENPLAARFMVAAPARTPRTARERKPYPTEPYQQLIQALLAIPLLLDGSTTSAKPTVLPLLPEAQTRFHTFAAAHAQQTDAITNATLRCHYANLVGVALRLALIFALCDAVSQQPVAAMPPDNELITGVGERHLLAGIALARWYGLQATRVYGGSDKNAAEQDQRALLALIRKHGGSISPWEMRRARVCWANTEDAERALRGLERAGLGKFVVEDPGPKGGRPAYRFKLHEKEPAKTAENAEDAAVCVSAAS